MTVWTDTKLKARQKVHETFAIDVVFYSSEAASPAVPDDVVSVRIHDKQKMVGDLAGTNLSYAEVSERPTVAILHLDDLAGRSLKRGVLLIGYDYYGNKFGFFVDVVDPVDGMTQTAQLSPLQPSDLVGKLFPDGEVGA